MNKPEDDFKELMQMIAREVAKRVTPESEAQHPDELPAQILAQPTDEEAEEAEREMQAEIAKLLAVTADIKQAIANQIAEAHDMMHQLGPKLALAGRMTAMLEPNPHDGQTEEDATEYLAGWINYVGKTLKATAKLRNALCYAHNRIAITGIDCIPGRQKPDTEQEIIAPGGDFSQFIGKLMPPGEA